MTGSKVPRVSRRDFLAAAGAFAAASYFSSTSRAFGAASDDNAEQGVVQKMRASADEVKVESQSLRGGVHVLIGSGGNIGVFAGDKSLLLVDSGLAGSRPQITRALAAISEKPLQNVVSTHWHFDHCDGNPWMRAAGASVIAHPNTKKHLSKSTRVPEWNFTFEPAPDAALPNQLVEDQMELEMGNTSVVVKHFGFSCHTDGDLFVRFPDADVIHTGDTFWNGHYPFIDTANGGSIDGMIRATETTLKLSGEKTLIIPGHGAVGKRADLEEFRDMLSEIRQAVAKLKNEGKTVEEAVAAKPTAKWDAKYADFIITPDQFTRIAYAGV